MPDDEPEERQLTLVANASMSHGSGDITPGNAVDQIVCSCQQYRNGATGHETYLCMGPREGWGTPCYPLAPVCNPDMTLCWNSGNTEQPTPAAGARPTRRPTPFPTVYPTRLPTSWPTRRPTPLPTFYPTFTPTGRPTRHPVPTPVPTLLPTHGPTYALSPHYSLLHRQADCGGNDKYQGRLNIEACSTACDKISGLFTFGRVGTSACLPGSDDHCVCRCELTTPVGAKDCYPYYGNALFDLYRAIAVTGAPTDQPSATPTWVPSYAPSDKPSWAPSARPTWTPSFAPSLPPSSSSCICPAASPTPAVCDTGSSACCTAWIGLGALFALMAVIAGIRRRLFTARPRLRVAEEQIAGPNLEMANAREDGINLPPHDSMRITGN